MQVPLQTNTDHRSSMETNLKDDSSSIPNKKLEDLLKMAKAKMGEVREENERLKLSLAQMLKDYQSLQKSVLYIVKQKEANKKSTDTIFSSTPRRESTDQEEPGLISLSLGRGSSTEPNKKDEKKNQVLNGGRLLSLGLDLDCRFDQLINSSTSTEPADDDEKKKITSSENRFHEDQLEEEPIIETRPPPSKNIKNMRNGGGDHENEQVMEQTNVKKARVSVRARCETQTMNDGCQWRKYGQKTAKGNPCPRAYYRCTVSPNCPVRKQVQRWVEDMAILITTYEGNHNHPLPISATAMASTTSAAASMLQCRSSTSQELANSGVLDTSVSTSAANLHGLKFTTGNIYNARPHHQFYFPNNYSSISTSNSHPTITLDLTTAPTNYNSTSHFNRLFSSSSTSNLNFSSPSSSTNYNSVNQLYNSYMQMNNVLAPPPPPPPPHHHQSSIATATTEVITSNPNFQSALAAAISSYIASKGVNDDHQQNMIGISSSGDNNSGLNNLNKWASASSAQSRSSTGCTASSFLNKLLSSNNSSQQQEAGNYNMSDVPVPSLPFSTSKSSASGSP